MHKLDVSDLTIDGFDLISATIHSYKIKPDLKMFYWSAKCLNGLEYSSMPEELKKAKELKNKLENKTALYKTPAAAIIAFAKRCCAYNTGRRYNGN